MGRPFYEYLDGKVYACRACHCHLASSGALLSKVCFGWWGAIERCINWGFFCVVVCGANGRPRPRLPASAWRGLTADAYFDGRCARPPREWGVPVFAGGDMLAASPVRNLPLGAFVRCVCQHRRRCVSWHNAAGSLPAPALPAGPPSTNTPPRSTPDAARPHIPGVPFQVGPCVPVRARGQHDGRPVRGADDDHRHARRVRHLLRQVHRTRGLALRECCPATTNLGAAPVAPARACMCHMSCARVAPGPWGGRGGPAGLPDCLRGLSNEGRDAAQQALRR